MYLLVVILEATFIFIKKKLFKDYDYFHITILVSTQS